MPINRSPRRRSLWRNCGKRAKKAVAIRADLQNSAENIDADREGCRGAWTAGSPGQQCLRFPGVILPNVSMLKLSTRILPSHVRAPSILAADFARQLPQSVPGLIVNMVDQRVWALNPRFYSYTLSKAALWTATQTMAQSFAPLRPRQRHRSGSDGTQRPADGGGLSRHRLTDSY